MLGDGREDVIERDAETLGFDNQLLDLFAEELSALFARRLGERGDDGADSGKRFEEPFGDEMRDDFGRSVGIDFQIFAERADRGEGVTWTELPGDHGAFCRIDNLLEERDAGAKLDAEWNHMCTMTDSTVDVKKKRQDQGHGDQGPENEARRLPGFVFLA